MSSTESPHQFGELIESLIGTADEIRSNNSQQTGGRPDPLRIEFKVNLIWESEPAEDEVAEHRSEFVGEMNGGMNGEMDVSVNAGGVSDGSSDRGLTEQVSSPVDEPDSSPFECPSANCTREFDSRHGLRIHHSKVHETDPADNRGDETGGNEASLYKDPTVLEEIYDEDKSFAEMTAELDADVSPSTVRRHMINFGIHQPSSYDTGTENTTETARSTNGRTHSDLVAPGGTDGPDSVEQEEVDSERGSDEVPPESPASNDLEQIRDSGSAVWTETDPIPQSNGLRQLLSRFDIDEDLRQEELKQALRESETLYETSRKLNVEREKIKKLLIELDLLDIVFGRLEEKERREVSADEIEERISNTVANTAM